MTESERKLLHALVNISNAKFGVHDYGLDHEFRSDGEEAVEVLAEYGLITPEGRGGRWTEAGRAFLNSS